MNIKTDFGFSAAATPDRRIAALLAFLDFWYGRQEQLRDETEFIPTFYSLPLPLQKFVDGWPGGLPDRKENGEKRAAFDPLRILKQLELSDDGKLIFLEERSGAALAATLTEGDDPPVWVSECVVPGRYGPWREVSGSLSETLVSVVLHELFDRSKLCLSDTLIDRWLHSSRGDVVSLWSGGLGPFSQVCARYSLWEGSVLILEADDSITYAANHDDGIAFLTEHQGEIERIRVGLHSLVAVTIESDGSAEVDFVDAVSASGHAPPGTFDFAEERDRLLALSVEPASEDDSWFVMFPRTGQSDCQRLALGEVGRARSLLSKAINAVTFKSTHFDDHLERLPSLAD